ncbi:MAG: hypothetical protein EGR47_04420 [Clostridium sp.]|nr:hypothetical protein [Clostridium sp.]
MLFCKNRYGILCIIYLNFILLAVSAAFQNKNRKIESEQSLERRGVFCAPVIADRISGDCMKRGNVHIWPGRIIL